MFCFGFSCTKAPARPGIVSFRSTQWCTGAAAPFPHSSLNGLHKDAAAAVVLIRERPPVAEERNCLSRGAALLELLPL